MARLSSVVYLPCLEYNLRYSLRKTIQTFCDTKIPLYRRNQTSGKSAIAVEKFFSVSDSLNQFAIEHLKAFILHGVEGASFKSQAEKDRIKSMVIHSHSAEDLADLTETILYFEIDSF